MASKNAAKRSYDTPTTPSKRPNREVVQCRTEEPHSCEQQVPGKKKYYTIWGGPNPGVHFTSWSTAGQWINGFDVKQRSFKQDREAWQWYQVTMSKYPEMANSRSSQSVNPADKPEISPQVTAGGQRQNAADEPQQDGTEQLHPTAAAGSGFESDSVPFGGDGTLLNARSPAIPLPLSNSTSQHKDGVAPSSGPPLSDEQAQLLELIVKDRKNVFYTGSAGVGKSRVLREIRHRLNAMGLKVRVVAPTGKAALEVNGQTIFSYAGWVPSSRERSLEQLKALASNKKTRQRLRQTDVLIIDEVSMVDSIQLERLNAIMKHVRGNSSSTEDQGQDLPFGGVQIVVTGDFCQLPPVNPFQFCGDCGKKTVQKTDSTVYECRACNKTYAEEDQWAFNSNVWKETNFIHVNLEKVFRQKDITFIEILQKLRLGNKLTRGEVGLLCKTKPGLDQAVKLFPHKDDVKKHNDAEFMKLNTEVRQYDSVDNWEKRREHHGTYVHIDHDPSNRQDVTLEKLNNHRYEKKLELKEGMLVILLANVSVSEGLVNGSQGTIIGFSKFWSGIDAQDTDEKRLLDIDDTLEGEYKDYRACRILDFMKAAPCKEWPVVRFVNRRQTTTAIIRAECYPAEVGDEPIANAHYSLLSRTQIPLMAGWAMTVHKSQGMTLTQVEVDLRRSFQRGMAYVALSRVTSLGGLNVLSFPSSGQLLCNEEVKKFLREKFNIQ